MESYIQALDRYTDEQFLAKPAENEWSLGQMYEHILGANAYFFMANVKRCLEQRKGQVGGERSDAGENMFKYNSLPPVKIKVPESLRGPELVAHSREDYRKLFAQSLQQGVLLAEQVLQDEGMYKTLHPIMGWLNATEWYAATEIHARHHFRQQKEREQWLGIA
ncbi:DinB family protein [Arundinibacter roseus]|nr:DinB family protein [Arundinibacter roseus]